MIDLQRSREGELRIFCYGFLKRIIGENLYLVGAFAHSVRSGKGTESTSAIYRRTENPLDVKVFPK